MKKIFFFFTLILLFTACNSDNYGVETPISNKKTNTVNIKASVPKFTIETNPLKTSNEIDFAVIQFIVYKENGEVYFSRELNKNANNSYPTLIDEDGSVSLSLDLPYGKYNIAFLAHKIDSKHPNTSVEVISPISFSTDDYGTVYKDYPVNKPIHNRSIYYNNTEITVIESETPLNIEIEATPMWSYLNLTIEDAQTFKAPEGTEALEFKVAPHYYGFSIKSKLSILPYPTDKRPNIVDLNDIRKNPSLTITSILSKTEEINNDLAVTINYIKKQGNINVILETRELKIPQTSLENGYYYNINGKLGNNNLGSGNLSMNISLGSFNKEEIIVPFGK